jgi:hypothetical protein
MVHNYVGTPSIRKPLVAVGGYGCGRGHFVAAVIKEYGYVPSWQYEPTPINTYDVDGNRHFAVYDLDEFADPMERCIIFVPTQASIPEKRAREFLIAGFPDPPLSALIASLKARGLPEQLAVGNPNWAALAHAVAVWEASGVAIRQTPAMRASWDEFKAGGEPPVDWGLIPYYYAYHQDPQDELANFAAWAQRKIPARISRILQSGVRLAWKPGTVAFPSLLRTAKSQRGRDPRGAAGPAAFGGSAVRSPLADKPAEITYSVSW